jgi:hypothetical protein
MTETTETSSYYGYSEETFTNVQDIKNIELTKKETFYFNIIDKFYKKLEREKVIMMIKIVEGQTKISLRLLDWFVTKYSNKHKIRFEKKSICDDNFFDKKVDRWFNVHISYKAQLKSYKKRYFDPFRRREKFKYYFDKDLFLCTTIGQLNFFKWVFTNDIIDYVTENYLLISKDITGKFKQIMATKNNTQVKTQKAGINITAKKEVKRNEVNIILSFD